MSEDEACQFWCLISDEETLQSSHPSLLIYEPTSRPECHPGPLVQQFTHFTNTRIQDHSPSVGCCWRRKMTRLSTGFKLPLLNTRGLQRGHVRTTQKLEHQISRTHFYNSIWVSTGERNNERYINSQRERQILLRIHLVLSISPFTWPLPEWGLLVIVHRKRFVEVDECLGDYWQPISQSEEL
jgi:hypothetical protein